MAPGVDECVVRDVKLCGSQLGPVLVTFEHAKLKDHDTSELKCGVFTSTSRGNTCTVAAVAEDGDVVYQGDVCKDGEDLCRNFLAVRNKRSNKVRIYEASSVMLSPSVASNFVDQFDPQDKKQAMYNLQHAFGSKKAKRVADQKARMEVNVDSVKEKLSTTVNDIKITEETLVPVEDDTYLQMLPPCNREASTPAEVYPISGILKKKEIQSLEKYLAEADESDQNLDPSRLSPFYQAMVSKTTGRPQAAALLLYAESLIRFCKTKKILSASKICLYSDLVNKRIMKDFLSGDAHVKVSSRFVVDKVIMYIIILGLHIGSYSVDLEPITQSVPHVDIVRMRQLARLVATRPMKVTGGPKEMVSLKVPLPSIQSLTAKGRKSRR